MHNHIVLNNNSLLEEEEEVYSVLQLFLIIQITTTTNWTQFKRQTVLFQAIQFSMSTQFNSIQKQFYLEQFSLV